MFYIIFITFISILFFGFIANEVSIFAQEHSWNSDLKNIIVSMIFIFGLLIGLWGGIGLSDVGKEDRYWANLDEQEREILGCQYYVKYAGLYKVGEIPVSCARELGLVESADSNTTTTTVYEDPCNTIRRAEIANGQEYHDLAIEWGCLPKDKK